jgi:hypothetical protein
MSDHHNILSESRTLTIQAAVFRALRDHGLEPELSDTSGRRVPPAETFAAQMSRILVASDIVKSLRATIGLAESERSWVHSVVESACRRHERQRHAASRPALKVAPQTRGLVSTSTATTTAVVFRRRIGGGHE